MVAKARVYLTTHVGPALGVGLVSTASAIGYHELYRLPRPWVPSLEWLAMVYTLCAMLTLAVVLVPLLLIPGRRRQLLAVTAGIVLVAGLSLATIPAHLGFASEYPVLQERHTEPSRSGVPT